MSGLRAELYQELVCLVTRHLMLDCFRGMNETNHFVNLGYGWLCKHCTAETAAYKNRHPKQQPALFTEGKAETPGGLLDLALAQWADATRQVLVCHRGSIEEVVNKA